MPTFVQMLSFFSARGHFDEKKDTGRLNEALKALQEKGAKILDVKVRLQYFNAAVAMYLITYESQAPLDIELRE